MKHNDLRLQALLSWLQQDLKLKVLAIQAASSDASFRRYFRVTLENGVWIVMDAPPERESLKAFIKVATILEKATVNVPRRFAVQETAGFMALEDFGFCSYLDQLTNHPETAATLYNDAFDCLLRLQKVDATTVELPYYDTALLQRELTIFAQWFVEAFLNLTLPAAMWAKTTTCLIASALEQPQVLVHRDFHSRNLMVLTKDNPGVLDFQDAVIGPISYDLVSLLKDCYIAWPSAQVTVWREQYRKHLMQANLLNADSALFKRWFDLVGLQRHLKAIGIFARLHLRDNKSGYLQDIPRTLDYVLGVCAEYKELKPLHIFLTQTLLPVYQQH